VVVAGDRYRAEDTLEAIDVDYRPLSAIVDPRSLSAARGAVGHDVTTKLVVSYRLARRIA
jgi:CO/xanthine dehydrogenase Mo-binding subunit